ncbi:hypothetical protein MAR_018873 [Mya arenaria]|uniref:Uncharacterized protein n=1 Tax=Mya arenaria TaxID=6604 RepID=A0ABY7EFX5_MYAAR|nr:hypothetical protein MAR_018873 [Mya arenaria]
MENMLVLSLGFTDTSYRRLTLPFHYPDFPMEVVLRGGDEAGAPVKCDKKQFTFLSKETTTEGPALIKKKVKSKPMQEKFLLGLL